MDYIDMGRRVRALRQARHMTQKALAEKADVSMSFLGNIERGTGVASLETLVKLCDALETDPNCLLEGSIGRCKSRHADGMTDKTRRQLAELFSLGYRILQDEEL